jgi:hypothetical protein
MALLLDGTDTKVSFQAAYRGLKDPTVGAPILDRAAQRRFAILVTLRQRKLQAETGFAVIVSAEVRSALQR